MADGDFWAATQEALQGAEPLVKKPKVRETTREAQAKNRSLSHL
jgi:hypothetical protein